MIGGVSARGTVCGLLALASFLSGAGATPQPAIRLASDTWPPFTDVADRPRLAIDLVHEALERAGIDVTTSVAEWTTVTSGLRDGTFDGSAAIWRNAERERFLLFSEPYLENRLVLVGKKGSDVSATDFTDLIGKRVAVVEQYAYGEAVDNAKGPQFAAGRSDQENLQKLLDGEVGYMLVDELLIRYLLEQQKEQAARLLEIGSTPLVRRTLHFAVRRDLAGAESVIDRFNGEIKKMLADGTYNDVLWLDWIRADVDGDGRLELVPKGARAGDVAPSTGYSILSTISREQAVSALDRYWIDGRVYDSWEDVPERYKSPPPELPKPPPALLRF